MSKIDREARILILGAGPAGLSAAFYLRRHGYQNVTVFEKLGRVGGLCSSITEDHQAFDLGAVITTPEYREVLRMARCVGARLEAVRGTAAFSLAEDGPGAPYHRLLDYLAGGSSFWAHLRYWRLCLRYLWKRFRLRRLFRHAGWAGFSSHPELCVSAAQWLQDNGLDGLSRMFEIPVTTFGYGNLNEIAAPYVLRYGSPLSSLAMLLSAARFSWLIPSFLLMRRFRRGFQRLWERLAWDLNVRLSVRVTNIERTSDGVAVTYTHPVQLLNEPVDHAEDRAEFDYLIIACPVVKQELEQFLDLSEEEAWLQSQTQFITYAVASFEVSGFTLRERIAFHLPLPDIGEPMIIYQPHAENELMLFYARLPTGQPTADDERRLREHIERYVQAFGGQINEDDDWHSYDAWLYFEHVTAEDFCAGYYDRWEQIQGHNRTFYTGGLFDFDYVEGAARYSRELVEEHFAGRE
jgi:protoporphyrinogen oxidase